LAVMAGLGWGDVPDYSDLYYKQLKKVIALIF
jgi:hypothetical protein